MIKIKKVEFPRIFPNGKATFVVEAEYHQRNYSKIYIDTISFGFDIDNYQNLTLSIKLRDSDGDIERYYYSFDKNTSLKLTALFDADWERFLTLVYWNLNHQLGSDVLAQKILDNFYKQNKED